MSTRVSTISTDEGRRAAFDIRLRVFVAEQGVPEEIELDEHDATAEHFLAEVAGRPVGTARMLRKGDVGVLGRLAVLPEGRGSGLGAALVRAVEERARAEGMAAVELHAQTGAQGFYERLGYQAFGEPHLEAGIPHVWMRKPLTSR